MSWKDYFEEARRDREGIFLEFTDDELKKYNSLRTSFLILLVVAFLLIETIVGFVIFFIIALHYTSKMKEIREAVYRRYLAKKYKKKRKKR